MKAGTSRSSCEISGRGFSSGCSSGLAAILSRRNFMLSCALRTAGETPAIGLMPIASDLMPVAITVTFTASSIDSSRTAPKMMFALSAAACWTMLEASCTSWSVSALDPVMFSRMPCAPLMDASSSRGLAIAILVASMARLWPRPTAVPITAYPMPSMIVLMSAKSRLMMPVMVMMSEMPWTPWRRMSSAMRNASKKLVPLSTNSISRSFGMQMTVSTAWPNSERPYSAWAILRRPSKAKGFVTTPTVSAPSSRARLATMGAPPVPVPPPRPAVTNTMSAPSRASTILSLSSSAAARPTSGLAPAPRPLVSFAPNWILRGAFDSSRAWRSVFATMNSTPSTLAAIIRLTAFPPPPPTPSTLILAPRCMLSEKSTRNSSACVLFAIISPKAKRSGLHENSSISRAPQNSPKLSHQALVLTVLQQPHPLAVSDQPDDRCIGWVRQYFLRTLHIHRMTHTDRQLQYAFSEGYKPAQFCAATRQHNARAELIFALEHINLSLDQLQQLDSARFNDLTQARVVYDPGRTVAHTRNFERSGFSHSRVRSAPEPLDLLRLRHWRPEPHGNIVREVLAANRNRRRHPNAAVLVDDQIRRTCSQINQSNSQLPVISVQARFSTGQRLKDRPTVGNFDARAVHSSHHVLPSQCGNRHHVDIGLQMRTHHAQRIADAVLGIQQELLRQNVQQLAVRRDGNALRRPNHLADVFPSNSMPAIRNGDSAARIDASNVRAADTDVCDVDGDPCGRFSRIHGFLDRKNGRIQINNQAFVPTFGLCYPQAGHLKLSGLSGVTNHSTGLAASQIKANQCLFFVRQASLDPLRITGSVTRGIPPRRVHDDLVSKT